MKPHLRTSIFLLVFTLCTLPLSNGRWLNPLAGFLGPLALLLFIRSMPKNRGLVMGYFLFVISAAIGWYSVDKVVSGPLIIIGATLGGITFYIPYFIDFIARKKDDVRFISTFYFPITYVAIEAIFSLLVADSGMIAYSQFKNVPLLQFASLFGTAGVTFVIAWTASFASWFLENRNSLKHCRVGVAIFLLFISGVFGFGIYRMKSFRAGRTIKVETVTSLGETPSQVVSEIRINPNSPVAKEKLKRFQDQILQESVQSASSGAKVVLWSEVLGSVFSQNAKTFIDEIKTVATKNSIYLIAALGIDNLSQRLTDNKVLIIDPTGNEILSYRKSHLAPGEPSIPGKKVFQFVHTRYGTFGTAICADFNYSRFIRAAGEKHVDVMFDPAYEWPEVARLQAATVMFRAVENGFNLVKSTSGGISLIADYDGRILAQTSTQAVLTGDVPVLGTHTFYSCAGWLFSFVDLTFFGMLAGLNFKNWWRELVD